MMVWSQVASQKMHAWVDLIFGVAQRGHAAKEACNVFYYLTYEGAADLDGIADPQQRRVGPCLRGGGAEAQGGPDLVHFQM